MFYNPTDTTFFRLEVHVYKFHKTALRMDAIGLGCQEAVQKLRDVGM